MLNFNVLPKIRSERFAICQSCKFYNTTFGTCGTPVIGQYVELEENTKKHYKEKIQLCGCVMRIKTKLRFASCPAHKWSAENFTAHEVEQLTNFVKSIDGKTKLDADQLRTLFNWKSRITNKPEQVSQCGSCIKDLIAELKKQLGDIYNPNLLKLEAHELEQQMHTLINQQKK
jgi:hypothetical protein